MHFHSSLALLCQTLLVIKPFDTNDSVSLFFNQVWCWISIVSERECFPVQLCAYFHYHFRFQLLTMLE